jgi:hypothetical protein
MANTSIVSSLFSQVRFTVVNSDGQKLSAKLNVSRVVMRLQSKLMRHSLEAGNTIVDARIIMPSTIDVDVFCSTLDDVAAVNSLLQNRTQLFTLTSKGLVFGSMMLDNEQLHQASEMLSAVPIHLSFKEVLVQNTPPVLFQQPADSSLIGRGFLALKTAEGNVSDLISSIKSSAISAVSRFF